MLQTSSRNQFIATIIANGCLFAGGIAFGWSSPINAQIIADPSDESSCSYSFCVTKSEMAWIASTLSVGSLALGFIAGPLMSAIGRKFAMLVYLILTFGGWIALTFGQNSMMLFLGRFLVGAGFGGGCVIIPIYIGEIADTAIRGKLLSYVQITIQAGILTSYFCGYFFRITAQNYISLAIVGFFTLTIFIIPESPRYFVFNNRIDDARNSIRWLRGDRFNSDKLIQEMIDFQSNTDSKGIRVLFTEKVNLKALCIALGLITGLQLTGINGILFYSARIFRDANVSIEPDLAAVFTGIFSLTGTIISSFVIDKAGRRVLILISSVVMFLCIIIMGSFFILKDFNPTFVANIGIVPIISLCLFLFTNSAGLGNVSFVMIGEIFAQNVKDVASGISMTLNYALSVFVTLFFPFLAEAFGFGVTFLVFSTFIAITIIFTILKVPETKGKSFQEIQDLFCTTKK